MTILNRLLTYLFDMAFAPFEAMPGWLSLPVFSILGAIFGLLVYKYTSNQSAIKRTKDKIKANLLAVKLFRDDLAVMFRACGAILICAPQLLRYSLIPFVVMIVPFVLVLTQLALRYQWRPVTAGETVVMTVQLSPDHDVMQSVPVLEQIDGVIVDAPPLRIPSVGQVVWRLRAGRAGHHLLHLSVGGQERVEKSLDVGPGYRRVGVKRSGPGGWNWLLYPSEPPLPTGSAFESIAIAYPLRESWIGGPGYWVVWFMFLSVALGFVFKPLFRVEF